MKQLPAIHAYEKDFKIIKPLPASTNNIKKMFYMHCMDLERLLKFAIGKVYPVVVHNTVNNMNKLLLIGLIFVHHIGLIAQVTFRIGSVAGNKGDVVTVDVSAINFRDIAATQYSMNYDSTVMELVDVTNRNPKYLVEWLVGNDTNALGRKDHITFSWNETQTSGVNIPDNERLFSLRFRLTGRPCDSSRIVLSNIPRQIEVVNSRLEQLTVQSQNGQVKINGPNCTSSGGGGGGKDLTIKATKETAAKGTVRCIKFCATNFKDVASMQFTIRWDVNVAQYNSFNRVDLVDISAGTVFPLPDNSGVRILWEPLDGRPVTLPDNAVLFEICLTATGNVGSMTNINFTGDPIPIEVTNGRGDLLPVSFVPGMLSITSVAKNLNLYVRDTTVRVRKGQSFCVPILVDGFTCVDAMQFALKFDPAKLAFRQVTDFRLGGLTPGNFNVTNDTLNVVWELGSLTSQTLPSGSPLFSVCFELLDDCPTSTGLSFINLRNGPIEVEDCNNLQFAINAIAGNITILCPAAVNCTITQGTAVGTSCFNTSDGRMTGFAVTGGVGPFTFAWRRVGNSAVVSTVLNPTNLPAGRYILTATDSGNNNATCTSGEAEITSPPAIVISNADITHESCAVGDGMISVRISGGTPDPVTGLYDVAWRRCGQAAVITRNEKLVNRVGGCYSLEVVDSKGCVQRDSFTINRPPLCTPSITENRRLKCFGDCTGSLFFSAYGGTTPYTFNWSNGRNTGTANPATDLCAGILTVTVTDANGATRTATYTIAQPPAIEIRLDSTKPSSGNNGEIYITVFGGAPPYRYEWRNEQNLIIGTTEDLRNLQQGRYNVCVTDRDTCTRCLMVTVSGFGQDPKLTLRTDKYAAGTDVSCKDQCDGRVIATVEGGTAPYTYRISPAGTGNGPNFSNLCPGLYTVTVTDASGRSATETVAVANAEGFTTSFSKINCATNTSSNDGSYRITVGGGTPPYSYKWCNNESGNINNRLAAGRCAVTITDANGCQSTEVFTVCVETTGAECYRGRQVISPNGDGLNDVFVIECVETTNNTLTIFDRWGRQVFFARNYLNTFNGVSDDGETLTEGTYMWVLRVLEAGRNPVLHKGTLTIVR